MIWEPVGAGVCVVVSAIGPSSFLLEQPVKTAAASNSEAARASCRFMWNLLI
jgi:hypothetical protein